MCADKSQENESVTWWGQLGVKRAPIRKMLRMKIINMAFWMIIRQKMLKKKWKVAGNLQIMLNLWKNILKIVTMGLVTTMRKEDTRQ